MAFDPSAGVIATSAFEHQLVVTVGAHVASRAREEGGVITDIESNLIEVVELL